MLNSSQIVSLELSQLSDSSSFVPHYVPWGNTFFNKRAYTDDIHDYWLWFLLKQSKCLIQNESLKSMQMRLQNPCWTRQALFSYCRHTLWLLQMSEHERSPYNTQIWIHKNFHHFHWMRANLINHWNLLSESCFKPALHKASSQSCRNKLDVFANLHFVSLTQLIQYIISISTPLSFLGLIFHSLNWQTLRSRSFHDPFCNTKLFETK